MSKMCVNEEIRAAVAKHVPWQSNEAETRCANLQNLCAAFANSGLANPDFVKELGSELASKFWSRVSEAFVWHLLAGMTFGNRSHTKAAGGPDFLVMDGNRRVWVEVVCPEPKGLPDNWREPGPDRMTVPHEAILLRWTEVIVAKAHALLGKDKDGKRVRGYLEKRVVGPDDAYVIAVNGCQLGSGPFSYPHGISTHPVALEAVLPVGPLQFVLDDSATRITGHGHQFRPSLEKPRGRPVDTFMFTDSRYAPVSAVWALDFPNRSGFAAVIHNPLAKNAVRPGFLPAQLEYLDAGDCEDDQRYFQMGICAGSQATQ